MINIAIDGPAGAGKSTVAKAVAKEMSIIYLDTGAMYRATAYYAIQQGIDVKDEPKVAKMLETLDMDIKYVDGAQQIFVNGINTTPYLREHYMSKAASDVSALPCVRYKLVDIQREFAKTHDVVLDGRDIGTFVLPDANCKFYMDATPNERADRRYKELLEKGQQVDYDQLLQDIIQRDYNDSHREVAPLKQAEDAEYIDTTNMTQDEVVAKVKEIVAKKTSKKNDVVIQNVPQSEQNTSADKQNASKKSVADKTKRFKPEKTFRVYRFLRVFLKPLQCILWPTKVVNKQNADKLEDGGILICNHYSKVDAFMPCFHLFKKESHILAKYELFKVRIAGWFLTKMGAIPVRRGDADIEAAKAVMKVLRANKKLLIFPEGTRNKEDTQQMSELKDGTARFAIKTQKPIVPMIYYRTPKVFRKNWLYVGEPFTLEEFYGAKTPADYKVATEFIVEKMAQTRVLCNEVAEAKLKKKK